MNDVGFSLRLAGAGISGVLLVLSLPKPDLHHLGWVALVPLLLLIGSERRRQRVFGIGYVAGLAFYAGTFYWIASTMSIYGGLSPILAFSVFAVFVAVFALHTALFAVALRFLIDQLGSYGLFLAPAVWVGVELLQTHMIFGGFPWMLIGYAIVPYQGLLQLVTWTGIYGLSFLLLSVNVLLAFALRQKDFRFAAAALLSVLVALVVPAPQDRLPLETLSVRLVQTNIDIDQRWHDAAKLPLLDELQALSTRDGDGPDLVVWPESPAPFYLGSDPEFLKRTVAISAELDAHFLLGYIDEKGNSVTNSAGMVAPSGQQVSRYDKMHLVPFGEYVPLESLLFFAKSLVRNVGDFAPGSEFTLSSIDGHHISTTICYEDVFPGLIRQFTKRGAEVIVNITNDGWFGSTSAPYQHLRMAVVRAVENRRYLVKATNTGITAIIDPYGRIVDKTELGRRTTLEGKVGYRSDLTFYVRYGDVFAYFMGLLTAAALAVSLRRKSVQRSSGDLR